MKSFIEEVKELQGPVDEMQVKDCIEYLETEWQVLPAIKTLEAVLKHYKDKLRQILTKDLLEWMQENDQTNFETDEVKVRIQTYVSSKINDQTAAFDWLNNHQYGDLIKDTLEFPKGEFSSEVEDALKEMGLSYTQKSNIHPQTLKKVMKDRLEDGEDLPSEDDGFDINYFDEVVVKEK